MKISLIQTAQKISSYMPTENYGNNVAKQSTTEGNKQDSVNISEEAKAAYQANQYKTNIEEDNLPLEAYSLPGWYADLLSDYTLADTKIGTSYQDSNQARYDSLTQQEKNNLKEYNDTLHTFFVDALHSRNINNNQDYFHNIVQNDKISESVHQEIDQQINNSPRMLELMNQFGITA